MVKGHFSPIQAVQKNPIIFTYIILMQFFLELNLALSLGIFIWIKLMDEETSKEKLIIMKIKEKNQRGAG